MIKNKISITFKRDFVSCPFPCSDITFRCRGNIDVAFSKFALSVVSEYFYNIFSKDMIIGGEMLTLVDFTAYSHDSLNAIFNVIIYRSHLREVINENINVNNVIEVLEICHQWKLYFITSACDTILQNKTSEYNNVLLICMALKFELPKLRKSISMRYTGNFGLFKIEIMENHLYAAFPPGGFELCFKSFPKFLNAFENWLIADRNNAGLIHMISLLDCERFFEYEYYDLAQLINLLKKFPDIDICRAYKTAIENSINSKYARG